MKDLRALRPFYWTGTQYSTGQLFICNARDAEMLVARGLAEYVSIAVGTPIVAPRMAASEETVEPIKAETKELKVSKVRKPKRK